MIPMDDRVQQLFDQLAAAADGVDIEEIAADQGIGTQHARGVIRMLRDMLAEDTINVVCDPESDGRWVYRLVGTLADSAMWATRQVQYVERRLVTSQDVLSSVVNATDGRSIEGRRARVMNRHFGRCLEDLREIDSGSDAR
jgi:hypothetical protein